MKGTQAVRAAGHTVESNRRSQSPIRRKNTLSTLISAAFSNSPRRLHQSSGSVIFQIWPFSIRKAHLSCSVMHAQTYYSSEHDVHRARTQSSQTQKTNQTQLPCMFWSNPQWPDRVCEDTWGYFLIKNLFHRAERTPLWCKEERLNPYIDWWMRADWRTLPYLPALTCASKVKPLMNEDRLMASHWPVNCSNWPNVSTPGLKSFAIICCV